MKAPIKNPKQLARFREAWEALEPVDPTVVKLTLVERCNAKCGMCYYWRKDKYNELSNEAVVRFLEEARGMGARTVVFSGGEATLRPDIASIIKKASTLGYFTVLLTNMSLLSNERLDKLIAAGLGSLSTSIDGSEESHDKIRGLKGMYRKIVGSLSYIAQLKQEGKAKLSVTVASVVTSENYQNIHEVLLLRNELMIDSFRFYPIREYVGQKPNPELQLTGGQHAHFIQSTIGNIQKTAIQVGMTPEEAEELTHRFYVSEPYLPCFLPTFHTSIDADGEVFPCCHAKEYRNVEFVGMGNVNQQSFKEIWTGEKYQTFRENIKTTPYSFCKECIYTRFNRDVDEKLKAK